MSRSRTRIVLTSVGVEPGNFMSVGALLALAYYFATDSQSWIPLVLGLGGGYLIACIINAFFTSLEV